MGPSAPCHSVGAGYTWMSPVTTQRLMPPCMVVACAVITSAPGSPSAFPSTSHGGRRGSQLTPGDKGGRAVHSPVWHRLPEKGAGQLQLKVSPLMIQSPPCSQGLDWHGSKTQGQKSRSERGNPKRRSTSHLTSASCPKREINNGTVAWTKARTVSSFEIKGNRSHMQGRRTQGSKRGGRQTQL